MSLLRHRDESELSPLARLERHLVDHRLAIVLLFFVVGILIDRDQTIPFRTWLLSCCLSILTWVVLARWQVLAVIALLLAVVTVGGLRHHQCWRLFSPLDLGFVAQDIETPVCLVATVQDCPRLVFAPERSPLETLPAKDSTRFRIRCQSVRNGQRWESATGIAQVAVIGHVGRLCAGDRIQLFGKISRPSEPMNPDEFDFRRYERTHRRLFQVRVSSPQSVTTLGHASPFSIVWYPQWLRGKCQQTLLTLLPRRQAELACAMILGMRDYLSRNRRDAFFHTGTIHLLAISGLHVGILAGVFFGVMRRTNLCADRPLLIAVSVLTFVYAVITEGKPPVLRASVLIWIVCLAKFFSRDGFALNSLSAAALVILTINPAQLFQVGFHLSFLAVISLVWLVPLLVPEKRRDPLAKLIDKSRPGWERCIRSIGQKLLFWFAASLSICCLTLPVTAHCFHLVSPIGLILNVFLWMPVAVALFSGFGTLFVAGVLPSAAVVTAKICAVTFALLEATVQWSESIPGSYQWIAGPTDAMLLFFYGGLSAVLFSRFLRRHSLRWIMVIALVTIVWNWALPNSRQEELRCTFLSVGHGSCVVIELPDGKVWLYDVGSIAGPDVVVEAVSEYLWKHRIQRLDSVFVSHADVDHFNGLPQLLDRFRVGEVVCSPTLLRVNEAAVDLLEQAIHARGIPFRTVSEGSELVPDAETGGIVRATVLHPPVEGVTGTDNANSLVLRLDYQGRTILLTGDIEFAGLDAVIDNHGLSADVAMAPHHGSHRSDPERFVRWCAAQVVVISAGAQHDIEPVCAMFDTLPNTRAVHTTRDGAIQVVIDSHGIAVELLRSRRRWALPVR